MDRHRERVCLVENILENTTSITLSNGFTVLFSPDVNNAGVSISLAVRAGYFDEPQHQAGITHVLEHVFCRRANASLAARRPSRPYTVSGFTIYNHTLFAAVVDSSDLALALDAMSEAYWHQTVEQGSFSCERRVVLHESARKADSSRDSIVEQLYGQLFPTHPIGRWRVGTVDSVEGLSAEIVEAFRAAYYQPANSVLSVAGNVDVDVVLRFIERSFGQQCLRQEPLMRRALETVGRRTRSRNTVTSRRAIAIPRFVIGWSTPGVGSREAPLFDVVAALVAQDHGLQWLERRRLGLGGDARHYIPGDVGVLVVRAGALPDTLDEVVQVACRAVDRLTLRRPSIGQLNRAKHAIADSWAAELSRPESRGRCLAEWHMLSAWSIALTSFREAMSATPQMVRAVARKSLHAELRAICIHIPARRAMSRDFVVAREPRQRLLTRVDHRPHPRVPKRRLVEEQTTSAGIALYRTASGLPVLFAPSNNSDGLVSVGLYIRGGLPDESRDVAGITKVLARTLSPDDYFHRRSSRTNKACDVGFAFTPIVDLNYFGWSAQVRPHDVSDAMELLSEFVQEATVSEHDLGEHQFHALGAAARAHENAMRSSLAAALRGAYGDHAYGLPHSGLPRSLRNLTVATVSQWRDKLFCRPRVAFAVVGPASAAAIRRSDIDIDLGSRIEAQRVVPSWPTQQTIVWERRSWRETGLSMLFPIGGLTAVEAPLHDLVATLAGGSESSLVNELRYQKALCYMTSGFVRVRELAGVIGFSAETAAGDVSECRDTITHEFLRLARGEIDDAVFKAAKRTLSQSRDTYASSIHGRLHDLIVNWFFRNRVAYGEYTHELAALSMGSVVRALRSWGDPSLPIAGLAGARSLTKSLP
jgi:zinc protease